MRAEEAGKAGGLRAGAQLFWGEGGQCLPHSPSPQEPLQRQPPLVPSPAGGLFPVSLSLLLLPHTPSPSAGCQQPATISMATLAPACSSTRSRSESRGRAAGLISFPLEQGSLKISSWLHTADSRPSRVPGGLARLKHTHTMRTPRQNVHTKGACPRHEQMCCGVPFKHRYLAVCWT